MDQLEAVQQDIERMIGISHSDREMFWALSKKCAALAMAPTVAAGATWGPGLVGAGSLVLPGIGTISGTTAAVLMMGAVWGSSYGACMSLLPGLIKFRDTLREDPVALGAVRRDIQLLMAGDRRQV